MSQHDVAIIGGGISGLSALHFLKQARPDLNVRLLEADNRTGGTIGGDVIDGYNFDHGPNGFLDREPLTLELCDQLNLTNSLERANDNVSNRFILRGGKLRSVPMSPFAFMKSDILPLAGKLRLLGEPFASARPDGVDESIYDFVKRRIGKDAADYLVQPMVSGVYGGLADRLSLKSCFPIMRDMEEEYGSLFKAMIAKARKAKREGKKSGGPSGPGGWLTSFHGGLYRLIESFQNKYRDCITTGSRILGITKQNGQFVLTVEGQNDITGNTVIVATPSYTASQIVENLSLSLSVALSKIKYAPIAVVCFGYDRSAVQHDLNGFGFLVPQKEKKNILGSIWTSSIFDKRAPEGKVQLRTMLGGDGNHDSIALNDEDLIRLAKNDLSQIIGLSGKPEICKIYRWKKGIPQYHIGHSDVVGSIEGELQKNKNLFVTGNAYYGIGLNDCIKQSKKVTDQILESLSSDTTG